MSKPLTETLERSATHPATREASEAEACGSMDEVRAEIDRIDRATSVRLDHQVLFLDFVVLL